jgi:molybdopterin molybdotransferase
MARELISVDEARARVLAAARPLAPETVPLGTPPLGRVLAEEVASEEDLPPFDSSAMDGFAVGSGEPGDLEIVDESRAGAPAGRRVAAGEAIAISTGAQVPEGTHGVVPVERTEPVPATGGAARVRVPETEARANVRRAGEDVRAGYVVLRAGTALGPAELAMLASLGRTEVSCGALPRVSVVVTGDELVDPGAPLAPGQIRDSNAPALAALASAAGARVTGTRRVGDDFAATVDALRDAIDEADVVCISGGVSVGEHDHVKPALAELGAEEAFWGVALKPGKPTWFGRAPSGTLVFGLPGNPVSAMVTFLLFARPALEVLGGADPEVRRVRARLDAPIRLHSGREQAIRCRLRAEDDGWHAEPTGPQGSHQISSMLGADALALVPKGDATLQPGDLVHIEPLSRGRFSP